jgi:transposase
VIDSHKSDDIIAVLKQQPLAMREGVEEVCVDMWGGFPKVMFGSAADTLDSHLEEICNYFNNRTTSGVTEGINTRIKLIVRQSYGFKNFDMMKEKLLACLFK